MIKIGLIREEKNPADSRVPLTPIQCAELKNTHPEISILVEPSDSRSYSNQEYVDAGVTLQDDLSECAIFMGVKEVPISKLIPNKTYFFFSHTKKKQEYNQPLMHALIEKKIRMIDYETLTYDDGNRIIGFGFFAGVVGAHNGLLTYGKKHNLFHLKAANACKDMEEMLAEYASFVLPPMKIVLTGSGRVASGLLHIMHALDIKSVEPQDFLENEYDYPVYTILKGADLYENKISKDYNRDDFHEHPEEYQCKFLPFAEQADLLLNGIYWDEDIERLFTKEDVKKGSFKISVIADVTCDIDGSVPITLAASTIADPVYGIDKESLQMVAAFQNTSQTIDIMAVDNLPNELPRDASKHFGEHITKFILPEILAEESSILTRATICENGKLTDDFEYLSDYAY